MGALRSLAAAAVVIGGAVALSGAASAAPVTASVLAASTPASGLVDTVQYWGPHPGYRRHWGPRPYWGGPRRFGPPVVCRFRPSPWGPRRVCFRRY
jgi:hypothetical protein